jgi:hypothetical protein
VTTTTGVMLDAAAATVRQDGYLRTGDQDQFHRKPWAGKRGRLGATVEVRTHCWLPSPHGGAVLTYVRRSATDREQMRTLVMRSLLILEGSSRHHRREVIEGRCCISRRAGTVDGGLCAVQMRGRVR